MDWGFPIIEICTVPCAESIKRCGARLEDVTGRRFRKSVQGRVRNELITNIDRGLLSSFIHNKLKREELRTAGVHCDICKHKDTAVLTKENAMPNEEICSH